jgi:flagellin-like hook-associated protein FlgL
MVALMPVHQDGNSAAERAILKSMMQSIDSIAHATEVNGQLWFVHHVVPITNPVCAVLFN